MRTLGIGLVGVDMRTLIGWTSNFLTRATGPPFHLSFAWAGITERAVCSVDALAESVKNVDMYK